MKTATFLARAALAAMLASAAFTSPCEGTIPAEASLSDGAPADAGARGRSEIERRGDTILARRFYDEEGALVEELFYGDDGILSGKRAYIRLAGRLARVEVSNADGKLLGAIDYRYDGDGRLTAVSPSGSLGSGNAGMIASGAAPSGSWMSSGAALVVQRFDGRGRPLRVETVVQGKAIARTSYAYGKGRFPERTVEENLATGAMTVADYDVQGRILKRTESSKGIERSHSEFRYDDEGRIVEERSRVMASLIVKNLEYDESGVLFREETRIDGVISEATERREGGTIVKRYHDGELFVTSFYSGGRKVKDEFYEDGTLVRSREYP